MLKRPFITRKFTLIPGDHYDTWTTKVSLVIRVIDDVTGRAVVSGIEVYLKRKKELAPILNASGYFCFTDLDPGTYTVKVTSDVLTADNYFEQEKDVTLPSTTPLNPLIEFTMRPRPSYPFPRHATLVNGMVREKAEPPKKWQSIADAEVGAGYVGEPDTITTTRTDHNGEFVLLIKNIKLETDSNTLKNIRIEIKKDDKTLSLTVNERLNQLKEPPFEEGTTAKLGIIDFPED
jgi:hypothetical protein